MTWWPVSARVGNVKNNDPSLIEPIHSAMKLNRWLGALLVLLGLGGCAQVTTGQGQAPDAPYSRDSGADMRGGGDGSGGGGGGGGM